MCFIYNAWKFRNLIVGNFLLPHHMPQISQKFSATYYRSRACFIEYVARQGAPPHAATCLKSQPTSLQRLSFLAQKNQAHSFSNLLCSSAYPQQIKINKQIVFSKPAEELSDISLALQSDSGISLLPKIIWFNLPDIGLPLLSKNQSTVFDIGPTFV